LKATDQLLAGSPYQGYLYSYPHKTSYRPFARPRRLADAWADQDRGSVFLYLHVPFCEMRCGFCNLFTSARPRGGCEGDIVSAYLSALERQARRVSSELGAVSFARLAVGGGTPTYLSAGQLERLFDIAETTLGADVGSIPVSVETSPETATRERIEVLRRRGVDRISIGVQSFLDDEVRAVGRAQRTADVDAALDAIRSSGVARLNIDLIYGIPGQTVATLRQSIEHALRFGAEEVFLYPLYVRPLTGLGRQQREWDDQRIELYRAGRDLLRERGYEQFSMRMFRRPEASSDGPVYCCQEDGMLGLGVGARSYTERVHYSTEYAVGAAGVREIIGAYSARSDDDFSVIDYGAELDESERRRRHVILSILNSDGLDFAGYERRFSSTPEDDVPELLALEAARLATKVGEVMVLTEAGFERADAIGPWLQSPRVQSLMGSYQLR